MPVHVTLTIDEAREILDLIPDNVPVRSREAYEPLAYLLDATGQEDGTGWMRDPAIREAVEARHAQARSAQERLTTMTRLVHRMLYPAEYTPQEQDRYKEDVRALRAIVQQELAHTMDGLAVYEHAPPLTEPTSRATLTIEIEDSEGDALDMEAVQDALADLGAEIVGWRPGHHVLAAQTLERAQEALEAVRSMVQPHVGADPIDPEQVLAATSFRDLELLIAGSDEDAPMDALRMLFQRHEGLTRPGETQRRNRTHQMVGPGTPLCFEGWPGGVRNVSTATATAAYDKIDKIDCPTCRDLILAGWLVVSA